MPAQAHRIERLNLDVDAAGLDAALRLRGRVEDLSRTRFPLVLERVLDAGIPADLHVRLDRLDLDLGTIPAERLEEDAPALLERLLAEAIADAVERARQAPRDGARALTREAAALEDLDLYLVQGTAPFHTGDEAFDPADSLRRLIEASPEALTAMLRRRARDRHALERLVLQAGAEDLRALLAMLAPADAAVILAYHADLQRLYLRSRAAAPSPALPRALWVLTLEFILRDPGSQSNRRAFLAYLLTGMAVAEGIAYPALLALLRDSLEQTRAHHPVTASLPGVLNELFARLPDAGPEPSEDSPAAEGAAEAGTGDLEPLLGLLRKAAGDSAALDALVRRIAAPVFARLVERLEPAHSATILGQLAALATLHRESALLALSETGFERDLRRLGVRLLLRGTGRPFDRRIWLRRLLRDLARAGGISRPFLLESLAGALAVAGDRLPAELAADLRQIAGAEPAPSDRIELLISRLRREAHDRNALAALVRGLGSGEFGGLVERLQPRHGRALLADIADLAAEQSRRALFAFSESAFEAQLRSLALHALLAVPAEPFHRLAWLRQLLQGLARLSGLDEERLPAVLAGGQFPPGSALPAALSKIGGKRAPRAVAASLPADADEAVLARRLVQASDSDRIGLIRRLAGDRGLLLRVAAEMDEAARAGLLAAFGRSRAEAAAADLAFLWSRHDAEPMAQLDSAAFRRLTWALAVTALAQSGRGLDRAGMRRFLLAGIASHQGVAVRELGNWRRLAEDRAAAEAIIAADAPPAAPLPARELVDLAERFLRTGRPLGFGPRLAEAASRDPAAFAALLRRLAAAASGRSGPLVDRLLTWMLPEEIAAVLLPASADRAANWAAGLADSPGGCMSAAWRQVLDAALANRDLAAADAPLSPGRRHDRLALLRHWLDRGTLAWWAPPDMRIETLLADLPGRPVAALRALFGDPDPERVAMRLGRAYRRMGAPEGLRLLEGLAPWAFAPAGPLAAKSAGLAGEALDDLRIRAACAALGGTPLDLDRLARPVPAPPEAAAEPPSPPEAGDRAALFAWLRRPGTDGPPPPRLLRRLADLADRGDAELDAILRDGLAHGRTRARWSAALPDEALARIVHRVAPARARFLLDLAAVAGASWPAVLAIAGEGDAPAPRAIAARLIAALAGMAPAAAENLRAKAALAARQSGLANVVAALQPGVVPEPPPPGPAAKPRAGPPAPPPAPEIGSAIYVANAGLVLFNPFLPRFFGRLGVLVTGARGVPRTAGAEATDVPRIAGAEATGVPRIAGAEAASRAVHLLQYLVDERCDRPEPDLALNKLLCGVPLAAPVARSIDPGRENRALCDELIQAVIGNWPAILHTSPAGLRETFLQRDGRLSRDEDRWTLRVERKTVDVLVDQIPWSRAVVYHRWMAEPVHVEW